MSAPSPTSVAPREGPRPLRLHANERLTPSPQIAAILPELPAATLNIYPDASPLEARLATSWGIGADRVLVTAGGDDAIDRICRVRASDGRELVTVRPTFEMFPHFAGLAGGRVVDIPSLDDPAPARLVDAVGERTGAVVVISPHNPTGLAVDLERLLALSESLPPDVWLVVDLAYVDFADEDPTKPLLERSNTVLVRTLSKAWGLAGIRVGYAMASPTVIETLRRSGAPYPLAGPSLWIAERALDREPAVTAPYVERVRDERERLAEVLREIGGRPFPSRANFVLAELDDAAGVADRLAGAGVLVRRFEHLPDKLRFTLPGDPAAFERLTAAIRDACRGPAPTGSAGSDASNESEERDVRQNR